MQPCRRRDRRRRRADHASPATDAVARASTRPDNRQPRPRQPASRGRTGRDREATRQAGPARRDRQSRRRSARSRSVNRGRPVAVAAGRAAPAGALQWRLRVHQVLATLGYGDAIGHEVLGIQRVLRDAGYESEIFVQTADPRLEHLTLDYRDLPDASHPDNILIHHFSIGSRASRMAYALPDRMVLVYHNITPPEYFVDVNKRAGAALLLGPARAGALQVALRSRRSAIRNTTGRSSKRSAFRRPACCRWCPASIT